MWRFTLRAVATIKAAYKLFFLTVYSVLTCYVDEYALFATSWQQPFKKALIPRILLLISVQMRIFMRENIRTESIFWLRSSWYEKHLDC
jgi:hypothetical protein